MAIYDNRDSQSGDHTSRDAAGRDIHHVGVDPALVLRHLDAERSSRDAMVDALERVWGRLDAMDGEARKAERDAAMERGIDFEARLKRQALLDADLAEIRRTLLITRRILVGAVAALALAFIVIGWLTADRFAALSVLHYWMGGAGALAYRFLTYGQR